MSKPQCLRRPAFFWAATERSSPGEKRCAQITLIYPGKILIAAATLLPVVRHRLPGIGH
jgi:hypothetical protein